MVNVFRILFVALLVLAVPVQGALAVSAGQCMALDHHGDGHDHGDGHADGGPDGHGDHSKNAHCGPCVACCAAAAISPSAGFLLPEVPTSSVAGALLAAFSGVQPDTLDRPPLAL